MNIRERLSRLLPRTDESWKKPDVEATDSDPSLPTALIRKGAVLQIVALNTTERGVRVVELPKSLEDRYWRAEAEWKAVQNELATLDYTHRSRPRRVRRKEEE